MRVHEYVFRSASGVTLPLNRWNGQPLLLVNTASACGFTPQYRKLEALWEEYRPAGLVVIAVPCNEFGAQEPGDNEEIAAFCEREFGVTFPVTEKQVILGQGAHPLFVALREEYTSDILPRWNFHKYLFSREGALLDNWPSNIEPDDPGLRHIIEKNLSSWSL